MTEQINQYLTQMAENTEAIAENQQKVYNAGRTAGMLEDVDYADGYKDGYVAGVGSFNGEVIDSILNGDTPVGKALEADKATTATYAIAAGQAEQASHAENATNATNATNAENAQNATNAIRADSANEAENASHADYATEAGHATTATSATSATYAEKADEADFAQVASRASAAYAKGTVSTVSASGAVAGYTYYKVSIALDVSPKLLILIHNTRSEVVICTNGNYFYNSDGEMHRGTTLYSGGTFSLNLPQGNPSGPGGGSWSYVAIM